MRRQAERLQLDTLEPDTAIRLKRFREYLERSSHLLERYHHQGAGGLRVCNCRTIVMDVLLENLLSLALKQWRMDTGKEPPAEGALLALGGYGRMELCPHSDIDIMFLYPQRNRGRDFEAFQKSVNDTVLYLMWDLGLKVGHSTRTPKEALQEAEADVQSKNSMIEGRFIAGARELCRKFQQEYDRYIRKDDAERYIEARRQDQETRRAKFGDTVFLQEPDLKNGVGGLRDYHNILWMARLKFDSRETADLVDQGFLRKSEHEALVKAYDFILRTRNELHYQSKRPTDVLSLERQPKVAWALGYRQHEIFHRVEIFMRDYYRHAKRIHRTAEYLEERLALEAKETVTFSEVVNSRRHVRKSYTDGLVLRNRTLEAENNFIFREDPVRLIRIFRHAQQLGADFDFELTRLIEDSVGLIDRKVRESADAAKAFRALLQERGRVYPYLYRMHTLGVLQKYMPEWAELYCLVQHEFYHRYTADEHTLNTIKELDAIFSHDEPGLTTKYREALEATDVPSLLYLVMLLHDIGKSRGISDHAANGAEMAVHILERLQVVPELREKIRALIALHLEMARFWQRYDVDDPRSIAAFKELVEDSQQLRYLYALTYCDARGTTPELWNSYKDALHTQLYQASLRAFGHSVGVGSTATMTTKETIIEQLPDLSEEEIEAHYNLLPERYFVSTVADEIALHLRMVHRLLHNIAEADSLGSLVPVVEWQDDVNLGMSVVHVVTWDRAGLFYKLAGAFSVAGLSIISSKALTRADHITIDTFYVCEPDGGIVRDPDAKRVFQKNLEEALLNNTDLMPRIEKLAKEHQRSAYLRRTERLRAPLPPRVDVYHELNLRRTIIEVQATDTIGLLYRLAKAIYDHGFDITFARISTERNVAVDTFYIEPASHQRTSNSENLLALRTRLNEIVDSISGMEDAL
ncbi:MAG: protein-PII uridylyltransferase [Puniceicoccaceae bacterium 5H]|nr:MAG: protein-PII uridylyltransferase [Puniceicoccaceae bacterium 5H]